MYKFQVVDIIFNDFLLEGGDDCEYDGVAILDDWTLSGIYCGNDTPPYFQSSGELALVMFYSDSSVVSPGFSAAVNFVPGIYKTYHDYV